jgi:hypothetical protein
VKKKIETASKGFGSFDAIRRMKEIEDDMRVKTVVKKNCLCVFKPDSDESLDCAVIFLHAGDNTHDARIEAERMGGVRNPSLVEIVELPESFDDDSVYWNHVYGG